MNYECATRIRCRTPYTHVAGHPVYTHVAGHPVHPLAVLALAELPGGVGGRAVPGRLPGRTQIVPRNIKGYKRNRRGLPS